MCVGVRSGKWVLSELDADGTLFLLLVVLVLCSGRVSRPSSSCVQIKTVGVELFASINEDFNILADVKAGADLAEAGADLAGRAARHSTRTSAPILST
eukprot:2739612-Rhodomonas_salina.1